MARIYQFSETVCKKRGMTVDVDKLKVVFVEDSILYLVFAFDDSCWHVHCKSETAAMEELSRLLRFWNTENE